MERPTHQNPTFDPVATAICQIEEADLPAPVYRTARRLLDLAAETYGDVVGSRQDLRALCGNAGKPAADGTMRSHLIQLTNAGIIQYHTNGFVAVRFHSWASLRAESTTLIVQRAQTRAERSHLIDKRSPAYLQPDPEIDDRAEPRAERSTDSDPVLAERSEPRAERSHRPGRAPDDQQRALSDQQRAADDQNGDHGIGIGMDWYQDPDPGTTNQTNHGPQPPSNPEHAKSFGMLVDVGIRPDVAMTLAHIPPAEVVRQIALWQPQHQANEVQTGALISRLKRGWKAPAVTDEFKRSDFYHRHFPQDVEIDPESAEGRRKRYIPDEYADIILG